MSGGQRDGEPLGRHRAQAESVRVGERAAHEGEVEPAGADHRRQFGRGVLVQVQAQPGETVPRQPEHPRQERVGDAADETEVQFALGAARDPLRAADGGLLRLEQMPGVAGERGACRGQPHGAGAAVQQPHAKAAFEALDRLAQRRLAHRKARGGPAEMLLLGQHDELLQQASRQIHMAQHMDNRPRSIGRR